MDFNIEQIWPLLLAAAAVITIFGAIAVFSDNANLNGIKSRQVGDGQRQTRKYRKRFCTFHSHRIYGGRENICRKNRG